MQELVISCMQELVILSEASLRAESKNLARSSARLGGDGRARAAAQGMDHKQEARADSQPKSENGGLREEDRARSFAPAAAAQDDARGMKANIDLVACCFDKRQLAQSKHLRARRSKCNTGHAIAESSWFRYADSCSEPSSGEVTRIAIEAPATRSGRLAR
jgi:hypothetical protein